MNSSKLKTKSPFISIIKSFWLSILDYKNQTNSKSDHALVTKIFQNIQLLQKENKTGPHCTALHITTTHSSQFWENSEHNKIKLKFQSPHSIHPCVQYLYTNIKASTLTCVYYTHEYMRR